ncbi:hypothetical protein GCM10027605_04430 [Micromonospora zhanjiangensis]
MLSVGDASDGPTRAGGIGVEDGGTGGDGTGPMPWMAADLELERRINEPEMKLHLGGPEPDERIVGRRRRMLEMPSAAPA